MLLRDVITNLFASVRGFRGSLQTSPLTDGFWKKRQWRAYHEFTALAAGTSQYLRLVATKPFLLQFQSLYVEDGTVKVSIHTGRTITGTPVWTPLANIFGKHLVDGAGTYTVTADVLSGASLSAGQEREVLRADSGGGVGVGSGNTVGGWRALPAGTYYFTITSQAGAGAASGIYSIEGEDLD